MMAKNGLVRLVKGTLKTAAVALPEMAIRDEVKIYPVPASGLLTLEKNCSSTGRVQWTIQSLDGRTVQAGSFNCKASKHNNQPIDISTQPAGVYLLRISGHNNPAYSYKIVKNKAWK